MNEHIQILNNYNPFVITGIVLSCLWLGAYILSWVIQWAWAWVDESKVSRNNWIASIFSGNLKKDGWYENLAFNYLPSSFYKYNQYKNGQCVSKNDHYHEYIIGKINTLGYFSILPLIWFGMLCLNFWYISLYFVLAYGIAFTARMGRRGQKMLKAHIEDKNAHKDQ